jgi:hypothetical protein
MTPAADPPPEPGDGVLHPRQSSLLREHVLIEAKLAAGAQDAAQLRERCRLIRHAAQHE